MRFLEGEFHRNNRLEKGWRSEINRLIQRYDFILWYAKSKIKLEPKFSLDEKKHNSISKIADKDGV